MTRADRYAMQLALCYLRNYSEFCDDWSVASAVAALKAGDYVAPRIARNVAYERAKPGEEPGRGKRVFRVRLALLLRALLRAEVDRFVEARKRLRELAK